MAAPPNAAATTIYGPIKSRARRVVWMAEELGLAFEQVDVPTGPQGRSSPSFLKLNPNGKVPVLRDGNLVLWESMAINLYLARKHGGPLAAKDVAEEGLMLMWSFWAVNELETHAGVITRHRLMLPEAERDEAQVAPALAALEKPLDVLDKALAENGTLVGKRFTVADLNVAGIVFSLRGAPELIARFPRVKAWYDTALGRPAAQRAFARG